MESSRFDDLSKSFAARSSRRKTLGLFGGGLGAALAGLTGARSATAATPTACTFQITGAVAAGPDKGTKIDGKLVLQIGDQGAIDDGTLTMADGKAHQLVGQATGRSLNLRVTFANGQAVAMTGVAQEDLVLCRGAIDGTFGGPKDGDLGTWTTSKSATTSGGSGNVANSTGGNSAGGAANGGTSNGGGSSNGGSSNGGSSNGGGAANGGGSTAGNASGGNGGNSSGGGSGNTSGGGGGSNCASGVVCGGVCCEARVGFTPDSIACDGNSCGCTYSCQAAGCPNGGTAHSFSVGCSDRPDALCGENCNFPTDNGCGNMTCSNGQTLNVDSCTCETANAACPTGQTNCTPGGQPTCVDLNSDPNNCGNCGTTCAGTGSGACSGGNCQ